MKRLYTFMFFTVILGSWNFNASAQNVTFPDANLAAAVRSRLGLASGADIPLTSLQGLTGLGANSKGITDLTGLEQATGLQNLALNHNQITDVTLLEGLTELIHLELRNNPITDFTPLSNLINLNSLSLIETAFSDSDIPILSPLTKLTSLLLGRNQISDITGLTIFQNLVILHLGKNQISDITPLRNWAAPEKLTELDLSDNQITDITPLARFTNLTQLFLNSNKIRDITALGSLINLQWRLEINENQISDLSPLGTLTKLTRLYFIGNQVRSISPLGTLTELTDLRFSNNQVRDLSPLGNLTKLQLLDICYNPYTDISPLAALQVLGALKIDEVFVAANEALVDATTDARLVLCPPLSDPPSEPEPEPETSSPEPEPPVKQRSSIARCGLGWAPHSQYQHHGELPKVMIYALEFEYDPEGHGRYSCKTIEIRTGDDAIENLAGWNLYLGTLYNPSRIPLKIPEEHSQITGRILRITPEMLGLETFPCNTVNGISHPLPGVQYVLKTDENVLIDTAYSCFIWGQIAYTTVNGKNVESPRRISSQALREMDTPRIERYVTNPTGIFITYIPFEDFAWDRAVLSDWLLGSSEETVVDSPNAPLLSEQKLTTSWGAIKTQPILRQRNFKRKPAR